MIFLIILGLIFFFIIFYFYRQQSKDKNYINLTINNKTYKLETAKTVLERSRGLSNRQELCDNCGMIFFAKNDSIQPFWMKNTLIPLDMIWVNSRGQVVEIKQATVENNPSKPQNIYRNSTPAQYVIELNYQETDKINLKIGDTIDISKLNEK
jgi:hypothetical protein